MPLFSQHIIMTSMDLGTTFEGFDLAVSLRALMDPINVIYSDDGSKQVLT